MSIVIDPELYEPIYKDGTYQDSIPFQLNIGVRCPCGSRRDKIFTISSKLKQHFRSIKHQQWLAHINDNRVNYYKQALEQEDTIKNQKIIIGNMEKEIINYKKQIEEIKKPEVPTLDLLGIN